MTAWLPDALKIDTAYRGCYKIISDGGDGPRCAFFLGGASTTGQAAQRAPQKTTVRFFGTPGQSSADRQHPAGAGEPLGLFSTYFFLASYVLLVAGAIYALPSSSALRPAVQQPPVALAKAHHAGRRQQ
jgi:hypothetical protein